MLTVQWQTLGPELGAGVPEELDGRRGGRRLPRRASSAPRAEHARLVEAGRPELAPYALCLGYRIRYVLDMNAREAMHLIELRSGREGHPCYRAVAHALHAEIARVHPAVAAAMSFVDRDTEPRLERILSEIRTHAKRERNSRTARERLEGHPPDQGGCPLRQRSNRLFHGPGACGGALDGARSGRHGGHDHRHATTPRRSNGTDQPGPHQRPRRRRHRRSRKAGFDRVFGGDGNDTLARPARPRPPARRRRQRRRCAAAAASRPQGRPAARQRRRRQGLRRPRARLHHRQRSATTTCSAVPGCDGLYGGPGNDQSTAATGRAGARAASATACTAATATTRQRRQRQRTRCPAAPATTPRTAERAAT